MQTVMKCQIKWTETNDTSILNSIKDLINLIENWDDLWIAYSVANIELEVKNLKMLQ